MLNEHHFLYEFHNIPIQKDANTKCLMFLPQIHANTAGQIRRGPPPSWPASFLSGTFFLCTFLFTSLIPRLSKNVLLVLGNQSQIVRNLSYKSFITELISHFHLRITSSQSVFPLEIYHSMVRTKNITSTSWHNWCFGILHLHLFVI